MKQLKVKGLAPEVATWQCWDLNTQPSYQYFNSLNTELQLPIFCLIKAN